MRLTLGLLLSLLLVACDRDTPQYRLQDYADRVARAARQTPEKLSWPSPPPYPRHRERQLPVPEVRARLLDLTDFNTCNLTQLIAERNSILGRYWPASRRIDYELRFAHRLQRCRRWLHTQAEADLALRDQMDAIARGKAGTLPAVFWQLSFDSPEFERHFSLATPWLPPGEAPPMEALRALEQLAEQLDAPPDGWDLTQLEPQLQALALSGYGGAWVHAMQGLATTLDTVAERLMAVDRQRLCPQQRPTPAARILETVFYRYYAGWVQPYLAQLHRDGTRWQQSMNRLLAAAPRPPPAFRAYATQVLGDGTGSLRTDLEQAGQRHTRAWQALLGTCGLMPGAAATAAD